MALSLVRQGIETESLVGSEDTQVLLRAEAMVSGAGREAVKILLADAYLALGAVEVQAGRVVLDGTVYAQAAYRLGDEASVRALTAQTTLNHAVDMDGAMAKMIARAEGEVEHVEASYENGHMIFRIAVRLRVKVLNLSPVEVISQISGVSGLEVKFEEICSTKLSAEANADALLREAVTLPAALDARCALMDWFSTQIEDVSRDLGGVRVTGKVLVEALIASGVKVPMQGNVLITVADRDKQEALNIAKRFFDCGYGIYATNGTAKYLRAHGIYVHDAIKISENPDKNILNLIRMGRINYVINTMEGTHKTTSNDGFLIRRVSAENSISCFTSLDTAYAILRVVESMSYTTISMNELEH